MGIRTLIENNGTMRLITGVELQAEDVKAIKEGTLQTEQAIEKELSAAMEKLNEDDYTLQPAKVLGWMLKNNYLKFSKWRRQLRRSHVARRVSKKVSMGLG